MIGTTSAVSLLDLARPSSIDSRMRGGVYRIIHDETGWEYIGKATTFFLRWKRHLHDLQIEQHHSWRLQRDWQRFGPRAFSFDVVEVVADTRPAGLYPREQYYLDTRKPYYNTCPVAGSTQGTTRGFRDLLDAILWRVTIDGSVPKIDMIEALREIEEHLLYQFKTPVDGESLDPGLAIKQRMKMAEIKSIRELITEMEQTL